VRAGAAQVPEVDVASRPALTCSAIDGLRCDGLALGTPANIGDSAGQDGGRGLV
jgi:hypothetical protein